MTAEHPERTTRNVRLTFETGEPTDADSPTCDHCGGAVAPAYRYCPWCGSEHDN